MMMLSPQWIRNLMLSKTTKVVSKSSRNIVSRAAAASFSPTIFVNNNNNTTTTTSHTVAAGSKMTIVRTNMYTPLTSSISSSSGDNPDHKFVLDPEVIFDEMDTNKDGFISKQDFVQALNRLNYYDLLKLHRAAHANMLEKLETVEKIERKMQDLAQAHITKQNAYNNIGMMTSAEIDALFEQSHSNKQEIHTLLGDLKQLINKTVVASTGETYYNNVGMTTASEIESLFPNNNNNDNNDKNSKNEEGETNQKKMMQ